MASGFLKEISALIRNSNSEQVASRLSLISSDSPKRNFLDALATKSYQVLLKDTAYLFFFNYRVDFFLFRPDLQNVNVLCQMIGLR